MGVQVETITEGDGHTFPKSGQTVVVHYTGTLTNGEKFDSSRDRGVPFKFHLGQSEVIKGWDQGVAQMCVGQRARLTCSPDFAYGSRGHPGMVTPDGAVLISTDRRFKSRPLRLSAPIHHREMNHRLGLPLWLSTAAHCIPPNATLIFDVELLKVEP